MDLVPARNANRKNIIIHVLQIQQNNAFQFHDHFHSTEPVSGCDAKSSSGCPTGRESPKLSRRARRNARTKPHRENARILAETLLQAAAQCLLTRLLHQPNRHVQSINSLSDDARQYSYQSRKKLQHSKFFPPRLRTPGMTSLGSARLPLLGTTEHRQLFLHKCVSPTFDARRRRRDDRHQRSQQAVIHRSPETIFLLMGLFCAV